MSVKVFEIFSQFFEKSTAVHGPPDPWTQVHGGRGGGSMDVGSVDQCFVVTRLIYSMHIVLSSIYWTVNEQS